MFISHFILQSPVVAGQVLPRRSYFHSEIKKDWHHSRAWLLSKNMLFTGVQVMGPHLVEDTTLVFKIMQTVTQTPTPALAILIHSQVVQRTEKQSWLGLICSHLTRWRFSILVESTLLYHNYTTNPGKIVTYFDSIYLLALSAEKQTF